MKAAAQKDKALLAAVDEAALEDPSALNIWWLGQSGFLVTCGSIRLLFDPYLSDSLTRKYAGTDKEHIRMTENVVEPGKLTKIQIVTSTHNHTDHLDAETLLPLKKANPDIQLIIPEANRSFVRERLGANEDNWIIGLDAWETVPLGHLTFTGVPAAHNEVERNEKGQCRFMGYIAKIGNYKVYHSGDTRPIPGLAEKLAAFSIDVALLPINGYLEERRVAGNLWGQEAAAFAKGMEAGCVIPCHYDMFTFNTETPLAFEETCQRLNQPYRVLRPGEGYHLHRRSGLTPFW